MAADKGQRGHNTSEVTLRIDAVLHAVTLAFDNDGLGVVQDAVEDGRGQRAVIVKDRRPLLVDPSVAYFGRLRRRLVGSEGCEGGRATDVGARHWH